jgi:hypothetical protein
MPTPARLRTSNAGKFSASNRRCRSLALLAVLGASAVMAGACDDDPVDRA